MPIGLHHLQQYRLLFVAMFPSIIDSGYVRELLNFFFLSMERVLVSATKDENNESASGLIEVLICWSSMALITKWLIICLTSPQTSTYGVWRRMGASHREYFSNRSTLFISSRREIAVEVFYSGHYPIQQSNYYLLKYTE